MKDEPSITEWIEQVKRADPEAARRLWDRYFARMVGLAARRLALQPHAAADAEDVALSAFHTFYQETAADRFPDLNNRDGLWKLLFVLTHRKAADVVKKERNAKHGG